MSFINSERILVIISVNIASPHSSCTFIKHNNTIVFLISLNLHFIYKRKTKEKKNRGQREKSSVYHILSNVLSFVFQFTNFNLQLYLIYYLIHPFLKKFQWPLTVVELLLVLFWILFFSIASIVFSLKTSFHFVFKSLNAFSIQFQCLLIVE